MAMLRQANETRFPTLFAIALDYLPIQASAVPCEQVFSSSGETDVKRRNRIHPMLMEALQMLKFSLKQTRLNFMKGWMSKERDITETGVDDEPDLLATLSSGTSNSDRVVAAVCDDEDGDNEISD